MNMKKRTAYIGIAYPLLYDYRHQAKKSFNDMWDSPNPIIESPLGLMIFYDEILFLCRSICWQYISVLPVYPVFTYTPKMIFVLGFHLFPPILYNFNTWQAFYLKPQNYNPICKVHASPERWMHD